MQQTHIEREIGEGGGEREREREREREAYTGRKRN